MVRVCDAETGKSDLPGQRATAQLQNLWRSVYLHGVAMKMAKLFKHGGSQAVRLPKDFRLEGTEVLIEKRGEAVVLRPKARLKTLADLARHMRGRFPAGSDFPRREQPKRQQKRAMRFE